MTNIGASVINLLFGVVGINLRPYSADAGMIAERNNDIK
jgi:hypothetical protein